MYTIDEFLNYYDSLKGNKQEIKPGVWVNAKPLPFYNGILTISYWKVRWGCLKDAWKVLRGKADAVSWDIKKG